MNKLKFKLSYLYIIFVIIAVILLVILSQNSNTQSSVPPISGNQQTPSDEIHKGLQNSTPPSKNNVSESFKNEMNSLKKAYEDNPNDTMAARQYADLLAASHQQNEAIPLYEKILKKNPKRLDILFSLSFIYYNERNFTNAEDETNKILLYDKDNVQAQYNLGVIAVSSGNTQKARLIWTKILQDYPNSDLAIMVRESLSKLK